MPVPEHDPFNSVTTTPYLFTKLLPNKLIEIPFPIMYVASLYDFKKGTAELIWEELFLELNYKDIHNNIYKDKKFKVIAYVGESYVSFKFTNTEAIQLKEKSTITSTETDIEKIDFTITTLSNLRK